MSLGVGLSTEASIWAARKIILSFSAAFSRAWMDEERPTMKGTRVAGNTTRSLRGIRGMFLRTSECSLESGMVYAPGPPGPLTVVGAQHGPAGIDSALFPAWRAQ